MAIYLQTFFLQTASSVQTNTLVAPVNHGGEFPDLTELSHADLNGLVSEIEGDDEIFNNFEFDNMFAEFEEKVRIDNMKHSNKWEYWEAFLSLAGVGWRLFDVPEQSLRISSFSKHK